MALTCAGIVLSGGLNSRMKGKNKAFLAVGGFRFLDRVTETLGKCFDEILLVTKDPSDYGDEGICIVKDTLSVQSPLSGIHAGLTHMAADYGFYIGCDTPFLRKPVVDILISAIEPGVDIVVPHSGTYFQPLCAVYVKRCASFIERQLKKNDLKVDNLFSEVNVKKIPYENFKKVDPDLISFFNVNSPEDLQYAEQLQLIHP